MVVRHWAELLLRVGQRTHEEEQFFSAGIGFLLSDSHGTFMRAFEKLAAFTEEERERAAIPVSIDTFRENYLPHVKPDM